MESKKFIDEFKKLFGDLSQDNDDFKKKYRIHQGWWRTAVLLQPQGKRPNSTDMRVCNTVNACEKEINEDNKKLNFLHPEAIKVAEEEIEANSSGIIKIDRLWNNLLSSQPLCFNFWAPLKNKKDIANGLLKKYIPDFSEMVDMRFEWAPTPKKDFTGDNSAFDIMIEFKNNKGENEFLGLECKYVDSLKSSPEDRKEKEEKYLEIFNKSQDTFLEEYKFYIQKRYNQLFRNQLMACSYQQKKGNKFYCGVFFTEKDEATQKIVDEYRETLKNKNDFIVIHYEDFIKAIQLLDNISWEDREWTMMLWARYIGLQLSENLRKELKGHIT